MAHYYYGYLKDDPRYVEIFTSNVRPIRELYDDIYLAVVGPFSSREKAKLAIRRASIMTELPMIIIDRKIKKNVFMKENVLSDEWFDIIEE